MKYTISLTGNKKSKYGSILGKVYDFQEEVAQHEACQLNLYRKILYSQLETERCNT